MTLQKDLENLLEQKQAEVKELKTLIADLKRRQETVEMKNRATERDPGNGKDNVHIKILDYGSVVAKHREAFYKFSDYKTPNALAEGLLNAFPKNQFNIIMNSNANKGLNSYGIYVASLIKGGN